MRHGQRKTDDWFPFYIDKWLYGSTRHELDPAEQSVWIDLLVLSKKDDGFIRANETTPYPIQQLAGFFNKPHDLIERTIKKLLDPRVSKLTEPSPGIYYVPSQESYELSDRQKRRLRAAKADAMSAKPDTMAEKAVGKNRIEENRIDKNNKPRIKFDFTSSEFLNITDEIKKRWAEAYPAVDIETFIKRMEVWQAANPKMRKENYERAFANWLSKEQDRAVRRGPGSDDMEAFEERQRKALGKK